MYMYVQYMYSTSYCTCTVHDPLHWIHFCTLHSALCTLRSALCTLHSALCYALRCVWWCRLTALRLGMTAHALTTAAPAPGWLLRVCWLIVALYLFCALGLVLASDADDEDVTFQFGTCAPGLQVGAPVAAASSLLAFSRFLGKATITNLENSSE